MADERDRWLNRAAADRMLRGEPAAPDAGHLAGVRAERLRAALDVLAEPPPADPGALPGELRGEAAAVAAFRAARGSVLQGELQAQASDAELFGSRDTVVELVPPPGTGASRSRRARPVRFALAAAVAGVAVGGLAAAAGAGLLDQDTRDSAGQVPAVSVTAGSSSEALQDDAYAKPFSSPRTTVPPGGKGSSGSPSPGNTPGADGRTTTGPGDGPSGGAGTEPSVSGTTGGRDGRDRSLQGGSDGETAGTSDGDREGRTGAVQLCRDYRAGRLDEERREKLVRLAKGLLRVPRYCQVVLDVATGGGPSGDAPGSPSRSLDLAPAKTAPPLLPGAGERR
ncbi:hypothetical protein OTB20_07270 [Streptomyces sp. H27-H1]|uniref:hypothetical protein n=1 Tax=Streptomyces sp. H27-H1 TaxID=2996461 RepID=UPI00226F7159|nr:hypothetical protein [Streptomyces sp. H27-H1]MCY0926010.1 hypothetical protein [Streptomyces sp. H27-H1]